MANLLTKLRIDYSSLTMLQGVTNAPRQETVDMHQRLLQHFTESDGTQMPIGEHERVALQEKTSRQLRLREMLLEHSNGANLIVMSMPMPRLVSSSSGYKKILELTNRGDCLLLPGNRVRSVVHVLAGNAHERYAAVPVGARQPDVRAYVLLVNLDASSCAEYRHQYYCFVLFIRISLKYFTFKCQM